MQLIDEHFCVQRTVDSAVASLQGLLWLNVLLGACAIVVVGFGAWQGKEEEEQDLEKVRNIVQYIPYQSYLNWPSKCFHGSNQNHVKLLNLSTGREEAL